jgi:hypothetical protein
VPAVAIIGRALALAIDYVKQRKAFCKATIDFQNSQFVLAGCKSEAAVAKVFLDHCISRHVDGQLDTATASMAKSWLSDPQGKIIDRRCNCSAAMAIWTSIRSRACVPRRARPAHLCRHQRDHEAFDRAQPVTASGTTPRSHRARG